MSNGLRGRSATSSSAGRNCAAKTGERYTESISVAHTHASLFLQGGENPEVVSQHLGHSSVAFTVDSYGHLMPGTEEAAAHLQVSLNMDHTQATVAVDGVVEPFPAFEMYAQSDDKVPAKVLFAVMPLPGASPWNLIGGPTPGHQREYVAELASYNLVAISNFFSRISSDHANWPFAPQPRSFASDESAAGTLVKSAASAAEAASKTCWQ